MKKVRFLTLVFALAIAPAACTGDVLGPHIPEPGNHVPEPGNHVPEPGNHIPEPGNHTAEPGS